MHERKSVSRGPRKVQRSARAGDKRMSGVAGKAAPRAKCGRALKHMGNHQEIAVGRSGERRLGQRVIESKASVMWYYETVADHSLATPVASDSHAPDTLRSHAQIKCINSINCISQIQSVKPDTETPTDQCHVRVYSHAAHAARSTSRPTLF